MEVLSERRNIVVIAGEPTLVKIARELVETVKKNVAIDRTVLEQAVTLRRCVQPHSNHPGHERDAGMKIR